MENLPVIRLHSAKETEFEFDVAIQRPSDDSEPAVRLVIENSKGYNIAIDCESHGNSKWAVTIPALTMLDESRSFHVEVIVDGYFFVPTNGLVEVISPPKVAIKESFASQKLDKPHVVATFESKITKKPKLLEYRDMNATDQVKLNQITVRTGSALMKVGKIMESGVDGKNLDTDKLSKLISMVQEGLNTVSAKIFKS